MMTCDERIERLEQEGWRVNSEPVRVLAYLNNMLLVGWTVWLLRGSSHAKAVAPNLWQAIDRALLACGADDGQILAASREAGD